VIPAGAAAGHPATAEAGLEILADGGTAADAAVAACLASCVAETVMTGLLGGGHAVYWDAANGDAVNLDCFVAVPGLGLRRATAPLTELAVPFGEELVHYAIGVASCAVPGVPAGLGELWRRFGRLPWPRLCEPALRLARDGVAMPPAHAECLVMLAPVMTLARGAELYAPEGTLLAGGDRLRQPGLMAALEAVADEGARTVYEGSLADALLALMQEGGGAVTREDLAAYRAKWRAPVRVRFAGNAVATRSGISGVPAAFRSLAPSRGGDELRRVSTLVDALAPGGPEASAHTTNLCSADAAGNACVLTTSLGLGSGDWLAGYDLHLNSMLGETDLLVGPLEPGRRMESMMAPLVAADGGGLALAAGAAGGTRLRSALVRVVAGILDEGLPPQAAVDRPRIHPADGTLHAEPGLAEATVAALERAGWTVRAWPALHHYFGGVSVVGREGAAGDPRRSGAGRLLREH
jgi:gamma-glutamyltranspeptidase / glutathione hydrolase